MAVGAASFVRGDTVQYSFDQLPDAVLPQIARLGHRDQGRRIHQETPFGPWAGRSPVSPNPSWRCLRESVSRRARRRVSSLYRRVVGSDRNMEVGESAPAGGGHQLSSGRSSSLGATTGIGAGEKAASSNSR